MDKSALSSIDLLALFSLFILYFLSLGMLNIYNFMDGINGITFLNALISYTTLLFINIYLYEFTNSDLLIVLILSILVFGYFNFRKKAICFAGDVGSITIGFSLIYFSLNYYLQTSNILIFFGSFPFILLSLLSVLTFDSFLSYNLDYLASLYALVIACFICGSYWGIFLNNQKIKINLFIFSLCC